MKKFIISLALIIAIVIFTAFCTYRFTMDTMQISQYQDGYNVTVFGQTDLYSK